MKLKTIISILALFTIFGNAKIVNLDDLSAMITSGEKDYYIWKFISSPNTTTEDAQKAIEQASYINGSMAKAYAKKTGVYIKAGTFCKTSDCAPPPPSNSTVQGNRYFYQGIKFVKSNEIEQALSYFNYSRQITDKPQDRDRATFWVYLLSQDKKYLDMLNESKDVNIYSLLGADFANIEYPKTITPKFKDVKISGFDITDPIHWARLKQKIFDPNTNLDDLAEKFKYDITTPHYSYIRSVATKYTEIYYPLPYRDALRSLPIERQAILYAIARQESRFIPASVSRSFALGMMQIMPFLIKHIASERGESVNLDDIFDPYKALQYSNHHLNYLDKYLHHPLFTAYAYNAGIGFTRRLIRRNDMFKTTGPYEPYLSIERVENAEAREYGKKVLTNYVVYMNKLGSPTRMYPLVQMLNNGTKIDRFRN